MGRNDISGSQTTAIQISNFQGLNNAVQFSQISNGQSPDLENLIPGRVGGLRHRPGTVPLTTTPRAGGLKRIFPYRAAGTNNIVATGGTTLYKYDSVNKDWDAQTMTNALVTDDVNAVQYRDDNMNEVLVIADGGPLKQYNGTAVTNIVPAASDADPLPANDLTTINTDFPPIGVTIHNNRLVIWSEDSDTIHHSKPGFFDYFPQTSFQRFVNNNDYVQTCISFGSSLIVFMRHHVAALFGDGYSETPSEGDWTQDFLDTTEGCINPRSVQVVVFPDTHEEVFYQTDNGVSAVFNIDTKSLDNSTRISTRSWTDKKVNWRELGITRAEWESAVSYFREGKYWLVFKEGAEWTGLVFDTNNGEWYPIRNVKAADFYGDAEYFYFIGEDGHLKVFDDTTHKDWDDAAKSSGDNVEWYWYSKLLTPGVTGLNHLWDILMIECQQFFETSVIDVAVNTNRRSGSSSNIDSQLQSQIMIVGQSIIGQATIANLLLTDFITVARELRVFIRGQYAQIKLSSSRGEPVELYNITLDVRPQGRYSN